jgi:heterodisulfide reductase subunit B
MDLTQRKLTDGKLHGADYLCTACPYCQLQFDTVQEKIFSERSGEHHLPAILYPQLLGLSMGIDAETLGLKLNQLPIDGIQNYLAVSEKMQEAVRHEKPI